MRAFLTILVIFLTWVSSISQTTDSLKLVLEIPDLEEKERIGTLLKLGREYLYSDPEEAGIYFEKALTLATVAGDSVLVADCFYAYSNLKTIQGEYHEAMEFDLKLLNLGRAMDRQGIITDALNNLGDDYFDQGAFVQAYDHYQQSRTLAFENKDSLNLAITTYNLGRVLNKQGQHDRARQFLIESRDISLQIGDNEGVVYCDLELADIDIHSGNTDEAYEKLIDAESIVKANDYNSLEPEVYTLMALLFKNTGKHSDALAYYSKLEEIHIQRGNETGLGESYLGKGAVWLALRDYTQAQEYLDKSIEIATEIRDADLLRNSYLAFSMLAERKGNYAEALAMHKKFKALDDSLTSKERAEQFANIQLLHETQQRDAQIELMRERQEQQTLLLNSEQFKNNILVVILGMFAIILLILYRGSVKRKKINKLLMIQKEEIEEKTREMEGLLKLKDKFLSIISHDLRSPINSLVGMLDMLQKGHLTQEETHHLFGSLKNRLDNTRTLLDNLLDWTLIQMDELVIRMQPLNLHDIVASNIDFFHETNDKHIIFFNKVDDDLLVMADHNMLDLVLRNLIVNSLKFTQEGGFIEIQAEKISNDTVEVSLSDNGIGMSEEMAETLFDQGTMISTPGTANERGTGLGLKLCREFVGRMGGEITVSSQLDEGSEFKFTLKIPQHK